MSRKKSSKNFGWTSRKSWNRADKTHEEKSESIHYSFKQPKKAKPKKLWCQPGDLNSTVRGKREGQKGRPYGYKPIYDGVDTYNYQSDSIRLSKANELAPELKVGRVYFYRASDDCYWHVVIPPDLSHEEFVDNFCDLPPDFFNLVLPEFWLNYPRPTNATPGQPLFPDCPEIEVPDYTKKPTGKFTTKKPKNKPPVFGCTYLSASNFNPKATIDDGSCIWNKRDDKCPEGKQEVCKDEYKDDPCTYPKSGCTDPEADNYDSCAGYDDGSCEYTEDPPNPDPTPNPNPDPEDPSKCVKQPKTECRWITVSKETALSGGGCSSGGFHDVNHGYVQMDNGNGGSIYKVLCCGNTPPPETKDSYWIDDGKEMKKITADQGTGLSICCDNSNGRWIAENKNETIDSGIGCPIVIPSCEKPSTNAAGFTPKKCPDEKWKLNPTKIGGIDKCECTKSNFGKFSSESECLSSLEYFTCTEGSPNKNRPGIYTVCAQFKGAAHRWSALPNFGDPIPYDSTQDTKGCVTFEIPRYTEPGFTESAQWRFTIRHERFVTYNFLNVAFCHSVIRIGQVSLDKYGADSGEERFFTTVAQHGSVPGYAGYSKELAGGQCGNQVLDIDCIADYNPPLSPSSVNPFLWTRTKCNNWTINDWVVTISRN